MKLKLPLIAFLAAGAVAGFLLLGTTPPLPSATAQKSATSRESPTKAGSPAASARETKVPAGHGAGELSARIQDALKAEPVDYGLAFGDLLRDLVKQDPLLAARLAASLEAGPAREEMMRRLAQYWAARDATSAEQWAGQLVDGRERDAALTDVCFEMAQVDPRQATLLADHYDLGGQPGAPIENLVMQWAIKDLTSVTAWVKARPEGEQKNDMLARVAMVMARTSPAEAAEMVATQLPEGNAQTESVISIIHQWAMRALPGARGWTELFPEGQLRERALGELDGIEQYQRASGESKQ
jgi:hypothetical protein